MKKLLFNAAFLVAGLLSISNAIAQQDDKEKNETFKYNKSKNYSKSYSINGSDKINLDNQFGEMKLVTWDKNEIKVDASITAKSDDEAEAQEILERISIEDRKESGAVYFKTKMSNEKPSWEGKKGNHHQSMEINYTVYLPSGNPLKAANQFGKMIVPDYRGEAEVSSKFGSLTAGKFTNAKDISVEFGTANIAEVSGGKLSIKFSNGTVSKLTGEVKANLEFSKVKLNLDNNTKNLTINNSYAEVYLDLDKSFSATYDITSSHGEFNNQSSFTFTKQGEDKNHYGPEFTKHYTGTSGSGSSKVKINSSFGETTTGHDLKVDMTEKKKKTKNTRTV
jgi:hypothetical protein